MRNSVGVLMYDIIFVAGDELFVANKLREGREEQKKKLHRRHFMFSLLRKEINNGRLLYRYQSRGIRDIDIICIPSLVADHSSEKRYEICLYKSAIFVKIAIRFFKMISYESRP